MQRSGSPTVVLVDGKAQRNSQLAQALAEAGYDVLSCGSAETALQLCQGHTAIQIDVVLTQIELPSQSGFDLADELERIEAPVKLLLTSGCDPNLLLALPRFRERCHQYCQCRPGFQELLEAVRLLVLSAERHWAKQPFGPTHSEKPRTITLFRPGSPT